MEIPPYNTKPVADLFYEYAFKHENGRICKKGDKYFMHFKVTIIPENLVVQKGKYTYHQKAMSRAKQWMEANKEHVFIEWWGPDNRNVEAIDYIIVRFRNYIPISWTDEINLYASISKNGSTAQKAFVGKKFGEMASLTKTDDSYKPKTVWQRMLYNFGNLFVAKQTYIYEDVRGNWDIYHEEIVIEELEEYDDSPRLD